VEADVAYGLVIHTHGWPTWNACIELKEEAPGAVPISLFPEKAKEAWGKVVDVAGVGSSCVLIHSHVLERLPYWRADTPEFQRSCDWYFAEECLASGLVQKCDTRVICGHIETDTMPMIRWPDITRPGFYRAEPIGPMPEDVVERVKHERYPNASVTALSP
jgi:hypothetical protein